MAFPQVAASVTGLTATSNTASQVITLPTGRQVGELLLAAFALDLSNTNRTVTWPAGWTEILDTMGPVPANDGGFLSIGARICDGTEADTLTVTLDAGTERGSFRSWRISGWHGTTLPEVSIPVAQGVSTAPDPPSFSPSWGAADTLWIAIAAIDDGRTVVSAFPANYTNGASDQDGSAGGATIGTARRELNTATENPGAFTLDSSHGWLAATLAVRPAGAPPSGYAAEVAADSPVHQWRLGEASGNAVDGPGTSDLTPSGSLSRDVTGLINATDDDGAVDFTGGSLQGSSGPSLPTNYSVEVWFRADTLPSLGSGRYLFSANGPFTTLALEGEGRLRWDFGIGKSLRSPDGGITTGQTYHVVATYDGTTVRLYVNGTQVASVADTASTGATSYFIGASSGGSFAHDGKIDEVAVYGTVLTSTRVLAHYTAGVGFVPKSTSDSGTGTDARSLGTVSATRADTGTGTDDALQAYAPSTADSGTGTDARALGTVTLGSADTATGTDAVSLSADLAKAVADSGTGTDARAATASGTTSDTGTGTDSVGAMTPQVIVDAGAGSDDAVLGTVSNIVGDAGGGTDTSPLTYAEKRQADSGTGTDDAMAPYKEQIAAETGTGTEGRSLSATAGIADSGVGIDEADNFAAARFSISLNGVNRSGVVDVDDFRVEERTGRAQAQFALIGVVVPNDADVLIMDGSTAIFAGMVREVHEQGRGPTLVSQVRAADYSALLEEDVVPDPAYRSTTETDKQRVEWLLASFGTKGITTGTYVQSNATLPGGTDDRPEQDFGGKTLSEALDQVAKQVGATYYVDSAKRLHWFVGNEGLAAPFALGDSPNGSSVRAHYGMELPRSTAEYHNAVYIRGAPGIRGWWPDPPPAAATRRAGVLRDESITSQAQLAAVGAGYLLRHGVKQSATCTILDAGLHSGMSVNVTSFLYGLSAEPFIVSQVVTRLLNQQRPVYEVTLGDRLSDLPDLMISVRNQLDKVQDTADEAAGGQYDLDIVGRNKVINAGFADDFDDWTAGSGWTVHTAGEDALFLDKVARGQRTAATLGDLTQQNTVRVERDGNWLFSAWTWIQSISGGTIRVELREYSSGGTLLATTTIADLTEAEDDYTQHSLHFGKTEKEGRRAFHANTARARVVVRSVGSITCDVWVGGMEIERGRTPTGFAPRPSELRKLQLLEKHIAPGAVTTTKIGDLSITSDKIDDGAIDGYAKFGGSVRPVEVVSSLPSLPDPDYPRGALVVLTTDDKIYRVAGSSANQWRRTIHGADDIEAATVGSGSLANGAVTQPKIGSGAVGSTQLEDDSVIYPKANANALIKIVAVVTLTTPSFTSQSGNHQRIVSVNVNVGGNKRVLVLGTVLFGTEARSAHWYRWGVDTGNILYSYMVVSTPGGGSNTNIRAETAAALGVSETSRQFKIYVFVNEAN